MRKIRAFLFTASILLVSCGDKSSNKVEKAEDRIDAIVSRIKGSDAQAYEYNKARKYHFIDIDGDGNKDVVSFFTIEGVGGGNSYTFYMSVLLHNNGKLSELGTIVVGGKGRRSVNFDKVGLNKDSIELETTEYGPDDPMCCPTKASTARFLLTGGVKEVSVKP
jgi:hypothetical protein